MTNSLIVNRRVRIGWIYNGSAAGIFADFNLAIINFALLAEYHDHVVEDAHLQQLMMIFKTFDQAQHVPSELFAIVAFMIPVTDVSRFQAAINPIAF